MLHNDKDRDVEIERMAVRPDGSIERRHALVLPGIIQCIDDYVSVIYSGVSGDSSRFMHWPRDATAPVELGVGNNISMSGSGIVFVPIYATMTVKQTGEQFREPLFCWCRRNSRTGRKAACTTAHHRPARLCSWQHCGSFYGNMVGISVIETGRDPVAVHCAELRIDGVTEQLQAAALSTWGARPALRFAYRVPADVNSLVVGAATCDPPRALSDDIVTCRLLTRMRVPSYADAGPEQLKEANHALIAIAEGGSRAFVLTADSSAGVCGSHRWTPARSPRRRLRTRAWGTAVLGLGAISDHEVLLLLTRATRSRPIACCACAASDRKRVKRRA